MKTIRVVERFGSLDAASAYQSAMLGAGWAVGNESDAHELGVTVVTTTREVAANAPTASLAALADVPTPMAEVVQWLASREIERMEADLEDGFRRSAIEYARVARIGILGRMGEVSETWGERKLKKDRPIDFTDARVTGAQPRTRYDLDTGFIRIDPGPYVAVTGAASAAYAIDDIPYVPHVGRPRDMATPGVVHADGTPCEPDGPCTRLSTEDDPHQGHVHVSVTHVCQFRPVSRYGPLECAICHKPASEEEPPQSPTAEDHGVKKLS